MTMADRAASTSSTSTDSCRDIGSRIAGAGIGKSTNASTTTTTTPTKFILAWPTVLSAGRRRRQNYQYSVDRLRVVYTDLLQHIDYECVIPPVSAVAKIDNNAPSPSVRPSSRVGTDEKKEDDYIYDDDGSQNHDRYLEGGQNNTVAIDDDGDLLDRAYQHRHRRSISSEDLEHHKRSLRFSFRKSLIPTTSPTKTRTAIGKGSEGGFEHDAAAAAAPAAAAVTICGRDNDDLLAKTKNVDVDRPMCEKGDGAVTHPQVASPRNSSIKNDMGGDGYSSTATNDLDLEAAFCLLAATRSPSDEHSSCTQYEKAAPQIAATSGGRRDSHYDSDQTYKKSMQRAQAIERRVVDLIDTIGIIVVNGEMSDIDTNHSNTSSRDSSIQGGRKAVFTVGKRSSLRGGRTDPVFEYFTEKCILSLLVEIAKEARHPDGRISGPKRTGASNGSSSDSRPASHLSVRGVKWSGAVKAQVYRTVSMLISDVRNQSVLFYLLSKNLVNELIESFLPIQQWTDPALALMLPAYVDLLKTLTLQLTDDPQLFPFLTTVRGIQQSSPGPEDDVSFPLFSAALEVATSYHGQSDSRFYATMLAVVVNIMQMHHKPIQAWMNKSTSSQRKLSMHLCQRLVDLYKRITNTTIGPVVDGTRHAIIASQLVSLRDHLRLIHEVFWSGVRGLDVRLCESLLRNAVAPILTNLSPTLNKSSHQRRFLIVGLIDADIIPESEAMAQVSTVVLSFMFSTLAYVPFQRMLAVALFHPESSPIWSSIQTANETESGDDYIFMPMLSDIVNKEAGRQACPNIFREELVRTLQGDCGEWRTTTTACLLQTLLNVPASESEITSMLQIISGSGEHHSEIEEAVSSFLTREHPPSEISAQALVVQGFLALQLVHHDLMRSIEDTNDVRRTMSSCLTASPVWNAMLDAHKSFCDNALACSAGSGVGDIFLDLIEAAIKGRYTPRYNETGRPSYTCLLSRIGSAEHTLDAEVLVRQMRGVTHSDVEAARFYIYMSLHFRSLCKVIDRLCFEIERQHRLPTPTKSSTKKASEVWHRIPLDLVDKVDDLCKILGGLKDDDVTVGSDLNLSGRMSFRFKSNLRMAGKSVVKGHSRNDPSKNSSFSAKKKTVDEVGVLRSTGHLMLVLDQDDILVVKPEHGKATENRGVVLCCIALRTIIAAASDGSWLHVATKQDDIPGLVKNGNMALEFDSSSTSLIVKQYLDRSREVLRQDMLDKARALLRPQTISEVN